MSILRAVAAVIRRFHGRVRLVIKRCLRGRWRPVIKNAGDLNIGGLAPREYPAGRVEPPLQ
jgi:hypothetical protein